MTNATFLAISDIHFDPFDGLSGSGTTIADLAAADASKWPSMLDAGPTVPSHSSHQDSNWALTKQTIEAAGAAAKAAGGVDFVLYPGDFLCHGWWHSHGLPSNLLEKFTLTAMQVIFDLFTKHIGDVPVFATFGNDDGMSGDYQLGKNPGFLAKAEPMFKAAVGSAATADFSNFSKHGCYTATLPKLGHRLVSLCNVAWSHDSRRTSMGTAAGHDVDKWFTDTLQGTDDMWLLMHIPPGHNAYGHYGQSTNWAHEFTAPYVNALACAKGNVELAFAGHTHMDDYRFVSYSSTSTGTKTGTLLHKIVPGVSPYFGQNPAFQIYTTDNGQISDWTTHYLTSAWHSAPRPFTSADPASLLAAFRTMEAAVTTAEHASHADHHRAEQHAASATHAYRHAYKTYARPIDTEYVGIYLDDVLELAPKQRHRVPSDKPFDELMAEDGA